MVGDGSVSLVGPGHLDIVGRSPVPDEPFAQVVGHVLGDGPAEVVSSNET